MSILSVGIESQPEFPQQDLTEENARMLSVMLGSNLYIQQTHAMSEQAVAVFRVTHPQILESGIRSFTGTRIDALTHGVSIFESMTATVAGTKVAQVSGVVALAVSKTLLENDISLTAIDDVDKFRVEMPRSTEVIGEASQRYFGGLTHYALLGASIERSVALASVDAQMNHPFFEAFRDDTSDNT